MKNRMNRTFFLLICIFTSAVNSGFSQKTFFVYLQTEQQQPFYMMNGNKSISSTATGYLIVPKLTDGTYAIKIGFPKSNEVQDYDLVVNGNDAGYIIKNLGDKGWGLYNLQTEDVQIAGVALKKRQTVAMAEKAVEEKRIADSMALVMAEKEKIRLADSTRAAALLAEQMQKTADSLMAIEKARVLDSTQAAIAKLEQDKVAEAAKPLPAATIPASQPAPVKTEPIQEKNTAGTSSESTTTTAPIANTSVEPAPVAEKPAVVVAQEPVTTPSPEEAALQAIQKQKTLDSLKLVAEQKRADSIRMDQANKEAQRKIDEAREIMRKVLGPGAADPATANVPTASIGATTKTQAEPPANKTQEPFTTAAVSTPQTLKKEQDLAAQKAELKEDNGPDTIVIKINNSEKPKEPNAIAGQDQQAKTDSRQKPVVSKTTTDPRFLDMEITGSETPAENPSKNSPAKSKPVETDKRSGPKKTNGLTSNNANTKIVEVPVSENKVKEPATKMDTDVQQPKAVAAINSACKEEATEKDFFTLRKKMAADEGGEDMLNTAVKGLKEKCYSVFQVRNLCVLFLKDEFKYRFLDMAYMHTSDPKNFSSLVDLLNDDYYIRRFNAMIRD